MHYITTGIYMLVLQCMLVMLFSLFNSDSRDLNIATGIRSPSFSTHLSVGSSIDGDDDVLHSCAVSHLESMDFDIEFSSMTARTSQFVSIDESGVVIFWITNEQPNSLQENLRRSPWGKVFMLPTRQIELNFSFPKQILQKGEKGRGAMRGLLDAKTSVFRNTNCLLAPIPTDSTSILVSAFDGTLFRYGRSGELIPPNRFHRISCLASIKQSNNNEDQLKTLFKSFQQISCIAVRPATTKSELELVLIGRADGSIDLFHLNDEFPICTWNTQLQEKKMEKSCFEIKNIFWLSEIQFLAIDANGMVYLFDLRQSAFQAILSEKLDVDVNMWQSSIAVSSPRSDADDIRLIIGALEPKIKLFSLTLNKSTVANLSQEDVQLIEERLFSLSSKSKTETDVALI